jgi:hypothetical protein
MKKLSILFFAVIAFVSQQNLLFAQEIQEAPRVRASAVAIAHTTVDGNYMKIVYGQPLKKGRVIFGELVPYDKVWRTGANEGTEITFTNDVLFGDKELKAGTYTLFTVPGKDSWVVYLNSVLGQWGEYEYDESKNVVRYETAPHLSSKLYEALTFSFTEASGGADLNLHWDTVHIKIPVRNK